MAGLARDAGVTTEVESDDATLWADPDRLVQTLSNLLSNAIKFSPAGGSVRLTASREDGEVLVRVQDDPRRRRRGACFHGHRGARDPARAGAAVRALVI